MVFEAQVIDRYPARPYADGFDVPVNIGMFCFPHNVVLHSEPRPPTLFSFALTTQYGTLLYCTVITWWYRMSDAQVCDMLRLCGDEVTSHTWASRMLVAGAAAPSSVYAPTALCIVSHHAFLNACGCILRKLVRVLNSHSP